MPHGSKKQDNSSFKVRFGRLGLGGSIGSQLDTDIQSLNARDLPSHTWIGQRHEVGKN